MADTNSSASRSRWDKENSSNTKTMTKSSNSGQSLTWRNENEPVKVERSRGISAGNFYDTSTLRRPRGQDVVKTMHRQVQTSLLNQEKTKVDKLIKLQLSAFKQVTSLRTWPLQERALRHFRELLATHLHLDQDDNENDATPTPTPTNTQTMTMLTGDSSSSSSSSAISSDPEPKRPMRDASVSPAQSRVKVQYRQGFLKEQAVQGPISVTEAAALSLFPESTTESTAVSSSSLWSMEPRIFSTERSVTGQRKYVSGHAGRFLDLYWRKADPNSRHYYELLPAATPVRLYLDLEFCKRSNIAISNDTAEQVLDELWASLVAQLTVVYYSSTSTPLILQRRHVIDLDSSTDTKFSRHWILHLPNHALFAHTAAAGKFVTDWIGTLADRQGTGQLQHEYPWLNKYLFVQSAPSKANPTVAGVVAASEQQQQMQQQPKTTCIVDLGVYTRNRLFRLMGSSKFGKPASAALRIADKNEFPFQKGFGNECFYLPAMQEHLQKQRRESAQGVDEFNEDDLDGMVSKFVAATDWTLHAQALAQTLVVPLNATKIDFPILPYTEEAVPEHVATASTRSYASKTSPSVGQSPYPVLDKFVHEHLATRGGTQGSIRAWSVDRNVEGTTSVSITYQMSRNRWCECVQRSHKSNNIFWVVDLVSWQCHQSCHDPECRSMRFRGTPVHVPANVREEVQDALFEEQLACLDEEVLFRQAAAKSAPLLDVDDDEAFELALMALNLDGDQPEESENVSSDATTPLNLEQRLMSNAPPTNEETASLDAGETAGETTPTPTPISSSAPTQRPMSLDWDSDSDSDFDLMELAAALERRQKQALEVAESNEATTAAFAEPTQTDEP